MKNKEGVMSKVSDEINSKITLEDILSDDTPVEEITASLARSCQAWYKVELERQRQEYKQELIKKIVYVALHDSDHIVTRDTNTDYITKEYLKELKKYFEDRDFHCELREYDGGDRSDLLISWEDD